MRELIDREATVKQICQIGKMLEMIDGNVALVIAKLVQDDKSAFPTVERPHGEWIYNQYDGNPNIGNWHCSECRHIVYIGYGQKPDYNFCPNCGASMVKEGEAE